MISLGNIDIKKVSLGSNGIKKISLGTTTVWESVYTAQDGDFVRIDGYWVYRGSETEVRIPEYINGELVTSTRSMFSGYKTYNATPVTKVILDNPHVTDMGSTFNSQKAKSLDLSEFYAPNVTKTNNMFSGSESTVLDLSGVNTSKLTDTLGMFYNSKATVGYARTQADADKFNSSSYKPATLTFVVKP